jgi:hypothetical protein
VSAGGHVLATLAALVALLFLAPAAAASPTQRMLFDAPTELLSEDRELRGRTLDELRALGVRDLRVILYWQSVAPQPDSGHVPGFDERGASASS